MTIFILQWNFKTIYKSNNWWMMCNKKVPLLMKCVLDDESCIWSQASHATPGTQILLFQFDEFAVIRWWWWWLCWWKVTLYRDRRVLATGRVIVDVETYLEAMLWQQLHCSSLVVLVDLHSGLVWVEEVVWVSLSSETNIFQDKYLLQISLKLWSNWPQETEQSIKLELKVFTHPGRSSDRRCWRVPRSCGHLDIDRRLCWLRSWRRSPVSEVWNKRSDITWEPGLWWKYWVLCECCVSHNIMNTQDNLIIYSFPCFNVCSQV